MVMIYGRKVSSVFTDGPRLSKVFGPLDAASSFSGTSLPYPAGAAMVGAIRVRVVVMTTVWRRVLIRCSVEVASKMGPLSTGKEGEVLDETASGASTVGNWPLGYWLVPFTGGAMVTVTVVIPPQSLSSLYRCKHTKDSIIRTSELTTAEQRPPKPQGEGWHRWR